MECKSQTPSRYSAHSFRINRNIVECKLPLITSINLCVFELIETLWNVNEEPEEPEQKPKKELIETLWNVNKAVVKIQILYLH